MTLLALLFVPVLIGLAGLIFSKGQVTLKEFFVQEAAMIAVISAGYGAGLYGQTADTEIWNGVITEKHEDWGSCCHSYPCNPHSCSCDSKGQNCSTCYDTCYRHFRDREWDATTSNGERAYFDGCNDPGSSPPARWNAIVVGEPTAIEHHYTNYIKGSPDTILRRQGAAAKFVGKIPAYPEVYDHYRAHRFITVGVQVPDTAKIDARLSEINARLGAPKQVNVVVIVAAQSDLNYVEALREAWLGGKKNDLVVVIGTPRFPEIAWTSVMSWTKNELIKIEIRDRVNTLKTFDGDRVLDIIADEVKTNFVRRPMADFEYLASTLEPPEWAMWTLFILGCLLSGALSIYFWRNDPFGSGLSGRYKFNRW